MTMAFPEGASDGVQRALNAAKRAELAEKFGGVFLDGDAPLPAEIECEFLQRIEEFELKWASHSMTTVREFIGDPPIRPAAELDDRELSEELVHLETVLDDNDIAIDYCERPDDREVYRFITEELFDHEIDDIRVPGMVCHFIYEEFHPNPAADARRSCEVFVLQMMEESDELLRRLELAQETDASGVPIDFEPVRIAVEEFRSRVASILDFKADILSTHITGNDAVVAMVLEWSGLESSTVNQFTERREVALRLRFDAYGFWEVVGVDGLL